MVFISINLGYHGPLGSGLLNKYPIQYRFKDFSEFVDIVRKYPFEWLLWAHDNHVSKSYLCFHLSIQEDDKNSTEGEYWFWDFTILAKNIREFQPYLKLTRDEVDSLRTQRERENKIDDLLNSI